MSNKPRRKQIDFDGLDHQAVLGDGSIGFPGSLYTGGAGGIADGDSVYISANNTVLKADASSDNDASGYIGVAPSAIAAAASGKVQTSGPVTARMDNSLTPVAGQRVFLSTTAGNMTNVKPSTSGNIILVTGRIKDATGYVSSTNPFVVVELGMNEGRATAE